MSQKLIIVSNRLPLSVKKQPDGTWEYKPTSGGLVTALNGLKVGVGFLWVGWIGSSIPEEDRDQVAKDIYEKYSLVPVFLPDDIAEMYYSGFSNSVLWPLLHYLPGETEFDERTWEAYVLANRYFLEALSGIPNASSSMFWIHDYHLMVLPKLISDKFGTDVRIGFFLHTPFPSSEVFRVLPVRQELLCGLAAADLIEFHTVDYARHFISSCVKILGASASAQGISWDGKQTLIGARPIAIDPNQFFSALNEDTARIELEKLLASLQGKTLILGVDRLDYIKGIPNKIAAYQWLLEKYPSYKENTVLIQVAVPSRDDVANYASLKNLVFELVGNLNSRISPAQIHLLYKSVGMNELVSLYRAADICLITSVRDGLNLVSHEYVASQKGKSPRYGALVLSEFAGAAQSLSGAICTNPWDVDDVAEKIHICLQMSDEERKDNFDKLFDYVTSHTALNWGAGFVERLSKPGSPQAEVRDENNDGAFAKSIGRSEKMKMISKTDLLKTIVLEDHSEGQVLVVLRNRSHELEKLAPQSFCLIADESVLSCTGTSETVSLVVDSKDDWMQEALPMMSFFSDRTPGSKILQMPHKLVWIYSYGDEELWAAQAEELKSSLITVLSGYVIQISISPKQLSITGPGLDLGSLIKSALNLFPQWKAVLGITDDHDDAWNDQLKQLGFK